MKLIAPFITLLVLATHAFAQTGAAPVFSVAPGDCDRSYVHLYKPGGVRNTGFFKPDGKFTGLLTVKGFSKDKTAEYVKIAEANPAKVDIVLDGHSIAEAWVAKPGQEHGIQARMPTLDDAFKMAKALVNADPATDKKYLADATAPAPGSGDLVFAITTADVSGVAVMIYKSRTNLHIDYSKEKQAEFSKIAAGNVGKNVTITLNGKAASVQPITKPAWGQAVNVVMPSPEEAFEMAKALVGPGVNTL